MIRLYYRYKPLFFLLKVCLCPESQLCSSSGIPRKLLPLNPISIQHPDCVSKDESPTPLLGNFGFPEYGTPKAEWDKPASYV